MTPVVVALARTRLALLALALLGVAAASVATLLYEQHRWLAILTGMSYLSLLLQVAKQLFARRHPAVYTRASGASALALEPALKYLRLSPLVCVLSLGREAPRDVAAILEGEHATRLAGAHAYR